MPSLKEKNASKARPQKSEPKSRLNRSHLKAWPHYAGEKVVSPEELPGWIHSLRAQGSTVATLNGSFDLLHAGHLWIIDEASRQADFLLVALNTDHSIQQYKSPSRPIIPLRERVLMMAALQFVDYVTWFDELDPCALLQKIRPNVHVNCLEYGVNCIEAETVKQGGGRLHMVERIPGLATSDIIQKVQGLCD